MRALSDLEITSVSGGDRWAGGYKPVVSIDGDRAMEGAGTGIWGGNSNDTWSIDLNKSDYQNKMANKSEAQQEQDLNCRRNMVGGMVLGVPGGLFGVASGAMVGGWTGGCLDGLKPGRPNNPFRTELP
jgi:hypothetical protein